MKTEDIIARLDGLVRPHLKLLGAGAALGPDQSLADAGLDSMGSIELLSGIEGQFGITIPDELLTDETFASLRTLAGMVVAATTR
jgi:acyl carrier protein